MKILNTKSLTTSLSTTINSRDLSVKFYSVFKELMRIIRNSLSIKLNLVNYLYYTS